MIRNNWIDFNSVNAIDCFFFFNVYVWYKHVVSEKKNNKNVAYSDSAAKFAAWTDCSILEFLFLREKENYYWFGAHSSHEKVYLKNVVASFIILFTSKMFQPPIVFYQMKNNNNLNQPLPKPAKLFRQFMFDAVFIYCVIYITIVMGVFLWFFFYLSSSFNKYNNIIS